MQQGPLKAPGSAAPRPPAATYKRGQGRQEDAQHVAPEHEAQHQQPRPAVRLGRAHSGSQAPAPLLQRHGDSASALAYACALQPCSATAAPGRQRRQLRLRTAAVLRYGSAWEPASSTAPAHCSPAPLRSWLVDSVVNCACTGAPRLQQHGGTQHQRPQCSHATPPLGGSTECYLALSSPFAFPASIAGW